MIKAIEENFDDIPEQFKELYSERDGKYELNGIEGLKTSTDVKKLQDALLKERTDHKTIREKFSMFNGMDEESISKKLAKLEELEKENSSAKVVPVEPVHFKRENEKLQKDIEELTKSISFYKQKDIMRIIHDDVRRAISKSKGFQETAIDDALMYAEQMLEINDQKKVVCKQDSSISPGADVINWLKDMQESKPHWWLPSISGGALGSYQSNGYIKNNPWTKDNWNMLEQNEIYKQNIKRAEMLAKNAGTKLAGLCPTK